MITQLDGCTTLNCNFLLWKLKELRVKAVSILGEGGEGALTSGRWGEPAMSARVCQLRATPWCVSIISWPACLLASAQGAFSHSLSPCHSSQVNRPQAMRRNYCTCSCSFASLNEEKIISFAKVYCHFNFLTGFLIFCCFQNEIWLPGTQSFSIFGSGRVGYRDPVGPWAWYKTDITCKPATLPYPAQQKVKIK